MDVRKYEAIIRIAEEGTVSAAAEVLGYSQAGVTQMLNSAEQEMGLKVFERTNKGAKLTEEGKRLLPLFRQIVNCQENIDQETAKLRGLEVGTVRIAGYSSIVINWIPRILTVFSKEHPGIDVWVTDCNVQGEALQRLRDGLIDIAFCKITEDVELYGEGFIKDKYLISMAEGNPLAKKQKISMKDLEMQNLLTETQGLLPDLDDDELPGVTEMSKRTHYSSTLLGSVQNMVKNDIGVSFSSELMNRVLDGEGVISRPLDQDLCRTLGYYVRSKNEMSYAAAEFIKCAKKVIRTMYADDPDHEVLFDA